MCVPSPLPPDPAPPGIDHPITERLDPLPSIPYGERIPFIQSERSFHIPSVHQLPDLLLRQHRSIHPLRREDDLHLLPPRPANRRTQSSSEPVPSTPRTSRPSSQGDVPPSPPPFWKRLLRNAVPEQFLHIRIGQHPELVTEDHPPVLQSRTDGDASHDTVTDTEAVTPPDDLIRTLDHHLPIRDQPLHRFLGDDRNWDHQHRRGSQDTVPLTRMEKSPDRMEGREPYPPLKATPPSFHPLPLDFR